LSFSTEELHWKYYIPLYCIFISMILIATRNFSEVQSSGIGLSVIHKLISLPLSIVMIFYYILNKKTITSNVPLPIKTYMGFVFIAILSSLFFSDSLGYSIWKCIEILANLMIAIFIWNLFSRNTLIGELYFDRIILLYKLILLISIIGIFIHPTLALRPPSLFREAFLPVQFFGSIIQINADSLGLMAAIVFYIEFIKYQNVNKRNYITIFILFLLFTIIIFAQSRTAIASLFIVLFGYFALNSKMGIFSKLFVFLSIGLSILFLIDYLLLYLQRGLTSSQIQSMSGRTEWWETTINSFLNLDFFQQLFGLGYGVGSRIILTEMGHSTGASLHSDYFDALISTGYLGLFFLLSTVTIILFKILKEFTTYLKSTEYQIFVGVLLILIIRSITGSTIALHNFFLILFLVTTINLYMYKQRTKIQ